MMDTDATTRPKAITRLQVQVRGIVQGVGFRPFVYKLAHRLGLSGHVFNSTSGVTIEIEGSKPALDSFLKTLRTEPPQLADIQEITVSHIVPFGVAGFSILHSREEGGAMALVPADAGTCDACWQDFSDPNNRRFGYPFTNCIHCGPRYTITEGIPYDRPSTTMSNFTMCSACAAEYADPNDRRFHAQPNACSLCGPSLALLPRGAALPESFTDTDALPILHHARGLLREGKILAVKGLGGFLFACDATNETAVAELRRRKHRPHKPFALMVRDIDAARALCGITTEDEAALRHLRRPVVILPRRLDTNQVPGIGLSVAPGNNTLGIMLPYTPLHYLLFSDSPQKDSAFSALVMTSGNISEEPIVISNIDALLQLDGVADWFLLHNREIATRVDDSVVRTFEGRERVLRRSRGFTPQALSLASANESVHPSVLAFGAELKNTFCLTRDGHAILSQHIGDLQNYETLQFFEETLAKMKRLFRVTPQAVAYDLHPHYMSTRMALASSIERKIAVQHHHAHIASCMAENHLSGEVIGVALDGTGYGTDGKIWGGEFFTANLGSFSRRAHLRYVPLPGGDAAVRQPWRMALSYLRDAFGPEVPDLACLRAIPLKQRDIVNAMIANQIQTVETSSCGRLFDAVAALLNLFSEVTFEGQAAIALESIALAGVTGGYEFDLHDGEPITIDLRTTILAIVNDLAAGKPAGEISARFHNTLSTVIAATCCRIRDLSGLDRVCLSGGSFQNMVLLRPTVVQLRRHGFQVFLHSMVPANDGGISLGQAAIACERIRTGA
ncbi:(NiFe) hydrogenase maturation protein HypF [Granulicella mallensis MP5ACTX8]|uniref:Carbamoyltransferase n=2 Tax=Granulicella mallensis TaxID=940614 RepID=G8NRP6_GRAMM|nr:(NiFe) hydrogenase maturation protein HypF [Granulicella mallensis MP5ACTX8]